MDIVPFMFMRAYFYLCFFLYGNLPKCANPVSANPVCFLPMVAQRSSALRLARRGGRRRGAAAAAAAARRGPGPCLAQTSSCLGSGLVIGQGGLMGGVWKI